MDGHDPLAAALRLAHVEEPPLHVDVAPVESQELALAQAGIGEEGEQQPVALALAGEVALPDAPVNLERSPAEPAHEQVEEPRDQGEESERESSSRRRASW